MRSPTAHQAIILPTCLHSIIGAEVKPLPSPKKDLRTLPSTPSPLTTPQSKQQAFDCVLLPSPRKSGSKFAKTLGVTEGAVLPRSRMTSPVPNAASSQVAKLRQTLRPVPRLLSRGEIIEGGDGGQGPSKRVDKGLKGFLGVSGRTSTSQNQKVYPRAAVREVSQRGTARKRSRSYDEVEGG